MTQHPADTSLNGNELGRLLVAAVVNQDFCNLLLTCPEIAMVGGYNGEPFYLTPQEQKLILSLQAISLADLATKLTKIVEERATAAADAAT
jgi:hypothetical protein